MPDPYVTWAPLIPESIPNPFAKPILVEERIERLEADLIVLALGLVPDTAFYESCVSARVAPELRCIGDAFEVGRIFDAVKAGYAVGRVL